MKQRVTLIITAVLFLSSEGAAGLGHSDEPFLAYFLILGLVQNFLSNAT
jgi:hypothetical protein